MIEVEVREQPDGTYVADRPALSGTPIVGRGNTWLEALGDLLIQDSATYNTKARVFDERGTPVPKAFFGPRYSSDSR